MKSRYKQTLKDAKLDHWKRYEAELIQRSFDRPHLWLKHSRATRISCAVDSDVLRDHFEAILPSKDTVPRETPAFQAAWCETDQALRGRLDEPSTVSEIYNTLT